MVRCRHWIIWGKNEVALSLHRFKKCWDPLKKHVVDGNGEAALVQRLAAPLVCEP